MLTDVSLQAQQARLMAPADFPSFRREERLLAGLNLVLQIALFLAQVVWPQYLGRPHLPTLAVLGSGVAANVIELAWLGRRTDLSWLAATRLTWTMILINLAVAFGMASYSYKQDVQYFALMIPPIFQAAFRFSFIATILTVSISDSLIFFWVWNYSNVHAPVDPNEIIEAGTVALIYAVMGLLVWTLVNHLRRKQSELATSLSELEKTQARLKVEERLAAVGRFSSAIAHEIRNPVAMISSALATASNRGIGAADSQEMYAIAVKEAGRLERLTTDFLVYARPRPPNKTLSNLEETIGYIGEVCGPRAASKNIEILCDCPESLPAEVDSGQLQQALLNLAMNAIEASLPDSTVKLRGTRKGRQVTIDVENGNGPIPAAAVACIFEPFFTTRQEGTGLGLAIARNIVVAHGGELALTRNDAEMIRFTISLSAASTEEGGRH
jgi:signal transduction histidine kinase